MRVAHQQKVAFLLLAGGCFLFCGSRFLPVSGTASVPADPHQPTTVRPSQKVNAKPVAEDPINRALNNMATFDFVDTPLKDVVAQISSDHAIPVKLDIVAIEDAGFDKDLPITGRGNGQQLRSAIKLLFMDYDFTATIKHNTLLLTTREAINNNPEKYMTTELYDITDLQGYDTDDLIMNIQEMIDPQSWLDTNGGPGAIHELYSEKKIVLVVSHTSNHHHDIVEFLDKLRAIENSN